MLIRKIFIIVPSAIDASPIKGAAALANALSKHMSVTFITLKHCDKDFDLLNDRVCWISLEKYNWFTKLKELRNLLTLSGDRSSVATISSCFSADFMNSLCVDYVAITCSSVRGNLPVVYSNNYGFMGRWLAYFHLKRLKKINQVVSMTVDMSNQVCKYINKESPIIGNFIDESSLAVYRQKQLNKGTYRLIFSGSLIYGKQPLILIDTIASLDKSGMNVRLDVFGDGVLLKTLKKRALELGVNDNVIFHGYVKNIYNYIARSDVLVLPSLSEGISRSALEALYLGIPCVLRNIDGSSELIKQGVNGYLFQNNFELENSIISAVELSRNNSNRKNLLPKKYRQRNAVKEYLNLLELDA